MADNLFAAARRSVWEAIDNWEPLKGKFRQKYRYERAVVGKAPREAPGFRERPTSIAEAPAIAIFPVQIPTEWLLNTLQTFAYTLSVNIWTPDLYVDDAESLWLECINAFWKAKPPDTNETYIRAAKFDDRLVTSRYPKVEPARITIDRFGDAPPEQRQKALLLTAGVTLTLNYQPRID